MATPAWDGRTLTPSQPRGQRPVWLQEGPSRLEAGKAPTWPLETSAAPWKQLPCIWASLGAGAALTKDMACCLSFLGATAPSSGGPWAKGVYTRQHELLPTSGPLHMLSPHLGTPFAWQMLILPLVRA